MAIVMLDADFHRLWPQRAKAKTVDIRGLILFRDTTDIQGRLDAAYGLIEFEFERAATSRHAPYLEIRDKCIVIHR